MSAVRVRFAPSPTGKFHIGSARTALFNWLFARHHNGTFILRIEDTDIERSATEYEYDIINSLKWLGLNWDEGPDIGGKSGPFKQSERKEIYLKYAHKLVEDNLAYKNNNAIKFKVYEGFTEINDIIRRKVVFNNETIDDFVIIKSNGSPTYNFAAVVDDYLMKITHVIRGEDHLSNTPKQVMLYKALEFEMPKFAHIPLIFGPDKARLSKRHGAVSLEEYKKQGYLPQALINFLALLGWSYGNEQIFTTEDLIENFSLEKVTKNPAIFDIKKLDWLNGVYIRKLSIEELTEKCIPFIDKTHINDYEKLKKVVALEQERLKKFSDINDATSFFFEKPKKYKEDLIKKFFKNTIIKQAMEEFLSKVDSLSDFDIENLEKSANETIEKYKLKLADLVHPVRFALTGGTISPPLFHTMNVIGKDECTTRIKSLLGLL